MPIRPTFSLPADPRLAFSLERGFSPRSVFLSALSYFVRAIKLRASSRTLSLSPFEPF